MTAMSEFLLSYYGELRLVHIAAALVSGAGFALRRGRKSSRVFFFVLALACYAYILTTARTRDPHGLLTLLGL